MLDFLTADTSQWTGTENNKLPVYYHFRNFQLQNETGLLVTRQIHSNMAPKTNEEMVL